MPYEEIPHTADWSLRVWADDLPTLFGEAALGMNSLAGTRLADGPQMKRHLVLAAADVESLLVSFLSELLFIGEQEQFGFYEYQVEIAGERLEAELTGAPILSIDKIIKAVTFHNLRIRQTATGCEVEIVFDV